jgi:hypothetical protein
MSDSQAFLMHEFLRHFFNVLERDKKELISSKFSTDMLDELWILKEDIKKDIEETKGETVAALF